MKEQQKQVPLTELRLWLSNGGSKLHQLLSYNEIPSYKIGKIRLIKRADVEK